MDGLFDDNLFSMFDDNTKKKKQSGKRKKTATTPQSVDKAQKSTNSHEAADDEVICMGTPSDEKKPPTTMTPSPNMDEVIEVEEEQVNISDKSEFACFLQSSERAHIYRIESAEKCLHEVAVPHDGEFTVLYPRDPPLREFPFKLDSFQKEGITCLDNDQSVLVSAHTSAGKTVVAEYAIAKCVEEHRMVIYTTPIKALSNQKYRDLQEKFSDVGLVTGDVTYNPNAKILVMTTEILRNMLYRGSQVMREVGWVIFDEIHYMRDRERGVVWEETIILLPDTVHYVFLSATIPNASQFAGWICQLHNQHCHVIYTDFRPTPLQHFIYPCGGDGINLIVDEEGHFRTDSFDKTMKQIRSHGTNNNTTVRPRTSGQSAKSNISKVVSYISDEHMTPAIIFSFSRKDCEAYGLEMTKMDFTTSEEKSIIQEIFLNAIAELTEDDRKLPQIQNMTPLLKKGVGIHHSGLMPIIKEIVEILFGEGLLKILFATETFAMGVNMPARTVVFTNTRKFDGKNVRTITPGEYIQMSGRAGRRGIDKMGTSITIVDQQMTSGECRDLFLGSADPLNSAFHLTYNMILQLLRVEGINPEFIMGRSFFQFQNYSEIPGLLNDLSKLEQNYLATTIPKEEEIALYYTTKKQLALVETKLLKFLQVPSNCVPFLQVGRLVKVCQGEDSSCSVWATVLNCYKSEEGKNKSAERTRTYALDVMLANGRQPEIVSLMLNSIVRISSVCLKLPKDLSSEDSRRRVLRIVEEVVKRFKGDIPLIDPVEDMGIKNRELTSIMGKMKIFEERLQSHPLHTSPNRAELCGAYHAKQELAQQIKTLKVDLKKKKSLLQMDELKCRKRVLRRLNFINANDVIDMKGRIACEISSGDELLLTELVFSGFFTRLCSEDICSILSCFVFSLKSSAFPKLSEVLTKSLSQLQEVARRIASISIECKLEIDEDDYVDSFKCGLMEVVRAWAGGMSFSGICELTDYFEGCVIRSIKSMEELLNDLIRVAKNMGCVELEEKFQNCITLIKRDIVFAASLYL